MTDTEDEAGQQREEEEEQDYDSIFRFFFQFTKPLVLELPSPEDRTSAAVWIQRLQAEPETEDEKRLRADYLKLLLFVMQRGRLTGMFKNEPPPGPLQPFPDGLGLTEMGNFLLEQAELQGSGDADGRKMSYNVEISSDLREFVAAQEIPDFGIQIYYAWSVEDPIYKWMSFDETKFPHHVREKIRQLKAAKSEEKTNVRSGSLRGDKTDGSLRRSCDSAAYDKNRAKVKSPEEIEKCLERSRYSYASYSSQRGSTKDKASDVDNSMSPSRRSKNHSPDALSYREIGASRLYGQESNTEDSDYENFATGAGRGGSTPYYSENAVAHSPDCPHSYQNRDTDTSKRLQKCEDANGPSQMNEPPGMAGPTGQRNADKCHSKDMYSESARCGGEAAHPQKTPCSSARGFQPNQAMSQPSVKCRKSRSSAQGCQSQQEEQTKKCICSSPTKGSSNQDKNNCSCPCPRVEKEISQCYKKKEKGQGEKTCQKPKPPCPEPTAAKRFQENPCPVVREMMKSYPRKMNVETPEGCTCGGDDRYKQQQEHMRGMGREKMMPDLCAQEVPSQQQQYSCSRKKTDKRDKRPTEQPEEPVPGSCSKSRPVHVEEMRKRADAYKEPCAPERPQQAANPSCCQQGFRAQDTRGSCRPYTGDYPASSLGSCCRNQDAEAKMNGRQARGECMSKRREAESRETRHSQRQRQDYPSHEIQSWATKRTSPNHNNYSCYQEPVPRSYKPIPSVPRCGVDGRNVNREEEYCDNPSSGSEENVFDEMCREHGGFDPNLEEECPNDFNANEEENAECAISAENVPGQPIDFCDCAEYPNVPQRSRPGYDFFPAPEQSPMTAFMTPTTRQKYHELNYNLPSRRRKAPDPRDFPAFNWLESSNNSQCIITSTPAAEAPIQPFACSPVSGIPHNVRSRWDSEDDFVPLNQVNQGGRSYSMNKESGSGGRKKAWQEIQCNQESPLQYKTIQDDGCNQDAQRMHYSTGNYNDANLNMRSQKWLDDQMKPPGCHYPRSY